MTKRCMASLADVADIWSQSRQRRLFQSLLLALCMSAIAAPAVQAATGKALSNLQAYALSILGLGTLALSIYLFVVMFQPERF